MEKPFRNAKIVLDEPRAVYYAGQLLTGHIECDLPQPVNFTAINVTFHGEGKVFWEESEVEEYNGVRGYKKVAYRGKEEYFNYTQCIQGGNQMTLGSGNQKIPFQFQLPHKIPSSFWNDIAKIKYSVTAYIDYPIPGMDRDELVKVFEVVTPMDFNQNEIKNPTELTLEEVQGCCCNFSSSNISVKLPASGYCPGQAIPITLVAHNNSNVEIRKVYFQLIKRMTYRSQNPPSEYSPPPEILESVRTSPILSHTKREITCNLMVPDMIAPNMDYSDIIDCGFNLLIKLKLSGCNDDLEDELDIAIGLVPIPGTPRSENYKHPMADSLPTAPIPPLQTEPDTIPAVNYNTNANVAPGYSNPGYPISNPGYPNSTPGYLNPTTGYSNPTPGYPDSNQMYPPPPAAPYPGANASQGSPLASLRTHDIGFIVPRPDMPYPSVTPPYPTNGPQNSTSPSAPNAL